jgi:hypothetical protein
MDQETEKAAKGHNGCRAINRSIIIYYLFTYVSGGDILSATLFPHNLNIYDFTPKSDAGTHGIFGAE